jgi:hypothetical protein
MSTNFLHNTVSLSKERDMKKDSKKLTRRNFIKGAAIGSGAAVLLVFLLGAFFSLTLSASQPAQAMELKDTELSDLVKKAYVYAFPVYEMYRTRYGAVYKVP